MAPHTVEAPRESTYRQRIDAFSASQCPEYRRRKSGEGEASTRGAVDDVNPRRARAYPAPSRKSEFSNVERSGNAAEVDVNSLAARAYPAQRDEENESAEMIERCEVFSGCFFYDQAKGRKGRIDPE